MRRDWILINPCMKDIAVRVAADYGLSLDDLRGPSQKREIAWPRQEAIAAIVATGRYTPSDAGRYFNRTYWTANHAIAAVESRRALATQEAA